MYKISDMKIIREYQMMIMDDIHQFCENNQLTYFLSSGTLLGAVRHGGYIPWDDDIDIHMPRESYDIFLTTYPRSNSRYTLVDRKNDKGFSHTYAKVIDNKTYVIEEPRTDYETGLWVDVFPVDGIPDNKFLRKSISFIRRICTNVVSHKTKMKDRRLSISSLYACLPLSANMAISFYSSILRLFSNSQFVCNLSDGGPKSLDHCFPRKCISSAVDIKFEDRIYKTMIGYETYLEKSYGNYMELPPEDKRVAHQYTVQIKDTIDESRL